MCRAEAGELLSPSSNENAMNAKIALLLKKQRIKVAVGLAPSARWVC